jgi:hypothetical protein
MKALFDAIFARFQDSILHAVLAGKLYWDEAPQETRLPYAVCTLISDTPGYTFTDTHERVLIQFDLYAADHDTANDLYEGLKDLFDDCDLTVAGYRFGKMERISAQRIKEPHYWRWIVEYIVTLEKV